MSLAWTYTCNSFSIGYRVRKVGVDDGNGLEKLNKYQNNFVDRFSILSKVDPKVCCKILKQNGNNISCKNVSFVNISYSYSTGIYPRIYHTSSENIHIALSVQQVTISFAIKSAALFWRILPADFHL